MTEWNIEEIISRYAPSIHSIEHSDYKIDDKSIDTVTYEKIKESYEVMANIVTEHGEEYLPIFARLHEELEKHSAKRNLLSTAFKISNNLDNQNE